MNLQLFKTKTFWIACIGAICQIAGYSLESTQLGAIAELCVLLAFIALRDSTIPKE